MISNDERARPVLAGCPSSVCQDSDREHGRSPRIVGPTATTTGPVLSSLMADGTLYIVNIDFDGGRTGEFIKADPVLVEDWVEAKFISEVDDRGDRIVRGDTPGGEPVTPDADRPKVEPARTVTVEDVDKNTRTGDTPDDE